MTGLVAVVIPCYNCSNTLARAIESVVNQSVTVNEIIVVDDCSEDSDQIKKICSYYNLVRYIKNKENLGLAGTRNIGIWSVKSDILTFLDADDEFHENKIEIQLRYLCKNNVVSTNLIRVSEKSTNNIEVKIDKSPKIKTITSPYQNLFFNKLVGSSIMTFTSTIKAANGYDSDLRSVEDLDLWLRILNDGVKVLTINAPLYFYHDTEGSLSKNSIDIWNHIVIVIKKFLNYRCIRFGSIFEQFIWIVLLSKWLIKSEASNNKDFQRQLWQDISRLLTNKMVVIIIKILVKLKFYRIISFLG